MARGRKPEKVLVVEGPNDAHLFWNLLDTYGFTKEVREQNGFYIEAAGGYTEIHRSLTGELSDAVTERELALSLAIRIKNGDIKHLGIVVDADRDLEGRWQSLRDVLRNTGYKDVPERCEAEGVLLPPTSDRPKVGVWIMPDNVTAGMMEHFAKNLRSLEEPQSRLWERAERVVAEIPPGERRFTADHVIKATIHTWLAWQEQPGKPIGQALKAGYLRHDADAARQIMNWFQELFALQVSP